MAPDPLPAVSTLDGADECSGHGAPCHTPHGDPERVPGSCLQQCPGQLLRSLKQLTSKQQLSICLSSKNVRQNRISVNAINLVIYFDLWPHHLGNTVGAGSPFTVGCGGLLGTPQPHSTHCGRVGHLGGCALCCQGPARLSGCSLTPAKGQETQKAPTLAS